MDRFWSEYPNISQSSPVFPHPALSRSDRCNTGADPAPRIGPAAVPLQRAAAVVVSCRDIVAGQSDVGRDALGRVLARVAGTAIAIVRLVRADAAEAEGRSTTGRVKAAPTALVGAAGEVVPVPVADQRASAPTHWLLLRQGSPGPSAPWCAAASGADGRTRDRSPAPAVPRRSRRPVRREAAVARVRLTLSNRGSSTRMLLSSLPAAAPAGSPLVRPARGSCGQRTR